MRKSGAEFPFFQKKKFGRIAIVCHRHADPDAYLSAYALGNLFMKVSPSSSVDVITPEGMSTLTQRLKQTFSRETIEQSEKDYDLFVGVDIGHTELLKDWLERVTQSKAMKVLIDHHPLQKDSIYDSMVVDASASSTAEVIFEIAKKLRQRIDPKTAQALLVAILFDSQHLGIASARTLRTCVELIDRGANVEDARRLLRSPPDYGEVMAKLKGVKRLKMFRANGWVIATTTVGSFQSHVARALLALGADVGIVAGESDGETRVSLRANQRFHDETKLHLGTQVAEEISREGDGYGGGHATAASFTSSDDEDEALRKTLQRVAKLLGREAVEVS